MERIDLRSDTVTRPTAAMRRAMADAPVGDDQYGEDPTTNTLQERIAQALGKQAALFLPSGTMANQVALRVLTRPGDDVIVGEEAHSVWHEAGGSGANAGVQFTVLGRGGAFTGDDFLAAYKAPGHAVFPPTTLVEIENTHNRGGGIIFPSHDTRAICAAARQLNVASYLDGARLFNVAVATGEGLSALAAPFDLVAVSLSKGLGCPVGSVLAGPRDLVAQAVRVRRMMGGGMRQCGIVAAAGLFALEHHVTRLAEDHANARTLAERLKGTKTIDLDFSTVQTNIIVFRLVEPAPEADVIVARCAERGVLISAFARRTIRAVTHLEITTAMCRQAADVIVEAVEGR
jgi:threonine aldolase